jgi:hypothetical protein
MVLPQKHMSVLQARRDLALDTASSRGYEYERDSVTAYYAGMPPERLEANFFALRDFLAHDHVHLGLVPATSIRHLRIIISPVHTPNLDFEINGHVCISSKDHRFIKRTLHALHTIQQKAGFRLTIVLGDGIWGEWTEHTLDRLKDTYAALIQAGMRIRV